MRWGALSEPLQGQFPRNGILHAPLHCENSGSRALSVVAFDDWINLQSFLKAKIYNDEGLQIWLPLTDATIEGEWRDFYNDQLMQNYTPHWVGSKPDGGPVKIVHP